MPMAGGEAVSGAQRRRRGEVRETTVSETICPDCGERNARGTEFCSACGAFLAWDGQEEAAPEPTPAVAPRPATAPPPAPQTPPAAAQPAPGCPAAGRRAAVGTAGRATGSIVAPDPTGRRCRRTDRGTTGSPRLERRRTGIRDTATRRFQRRIDRPGGRPAAGWLAGIGLGRPGAGSTAARPAGSAAAGPAGLPGTARTTSADRGSLSPLRCRQQRVAAVLQQVRAGASWSDVARRRRSEK